MKRAALFSFACAWLAACETPPSAPTLRRPTAVPPSFAIIVNDRSPGGFGTENPCNGDPVFLEGEIHTMLEFTADEDGGLHVFMTVRERYEGVGVATGAKYVVDQTSHAIGYARPPFPVTHTTLRMINVIAQGDVPNFRFRSGFHITINANGVTTAEPVQFASECQG